ncbi:unnamed protein product [Prunus armeniaca]
MQGMQSGTLVELGTWATIIHMQYLYVRREILSCGEDMRGHRLMMTRCRRHCLLQMMARGCQRQHKARLSQDNVARHEGARGNTKLACRKAMWLGTRAPEATQSSHVARQCG